MHNRCNTDMIVSRLADCVRTAIIPEPIKKRFPTIDRRVTMATAIANETVSPKTTVTSEAQTSTRIIDCDVHHSFPDSTALFPYLPRQYIEYIKDFGDMM